MTVKIFSWFPATHHGFLEVRKSNEIYKRRHLTRINLLIEINK